MAIRLCISLAHNERKIEYTRGPRKWAPGLVNFVPALAYHICLALPAEFTQPGDHLLAEPCRVCTLYWLDLDIMGIMKKLCWYLESYT